MLHHDPPFDALRNAIYHTERKVFLDRLNRIFSSLLIILGAGVAAKMANALHFKDWYLEFSIVTIATLQLIFEFGDRARRHEFLQQRYYWLLAEMEGKRQAEAVQAL